MRYLQMIRRTSKALFEFGLHFAHGAVMVAGVVALLALGHTLWARGVDALRPLAEPLWSWTRTATELALADEAAERVSPRMRAVADYVARKYRVADRACLQLMAAVEDAAAREGVDPLLVVAVMAVESSFNPIAQSNMGAQGLMQVIPRYHQDKLEDMPAGLLDPATNIRVGARVLRAYLDQTDSLVAALQVYGGATHDAETTYANRVLEEKQRLEEAARRARGVPA